MGSSNPPTVAILAVRTPSGLVLVRRGLADGYGKLALPGGYQEAGETWQEAGVRELREETGCVVDPADVRLLDAITVPSGHNLLFGRVAGTVPDFEPKPDRETLEVVFTKVPVLTAFPTHTRIVVDHFLSTGFFADASWYARNGLSEFLCG